MGIAVREITPDQIEKFRRRVALADPADNEADAEDDKVDAENLNLGDPMALRGVPLVGVQGVGGAIGGTRPGDSSATLERDNRYIAKRRRRPRA